MADGDQPTDRSSESEPAESDTAESEPAESDTAESEPAESDTAESDTAQLAPFHPAPDLAELRVAYTDYLLDAHRYLDFKGVPQVEKVVA